MDSKSEEFEVTANQLSKLMEKRGGEGAEVVKKLGGVMNICKILKTSHTEGLAGDDEDLMRRKQVFGHNIVPKKKPKSFLSLVKEALLDSTLLILQAAALISIILYFCTPKTDQEEKRDSSWIESVGIITSVVIVVFVTASNNYSKERQFQNLREKIEDIHATFVIRGGEMKQILLSEVVVGDICHIQYGDVVPADGIFISGSDLVIDESTLTGESRSILKGEFDPIVLSGTQVMEGMGRILVTAVGIYSQTGVMYSLLGVVKNTDRKKSKSKTSATFKKISIFDSVLEEEKDIEEMDQTFQDASSEDGRSVLQIKLFKMASQIGYAACFIGALTFFILIGQFTIKTFIIEKKVWKTRYLNDMIHCLLVGVTVLVVAIPEGLPLAVTLSLAYSVKKMMSDNNLVRHLDACETMGNATMICSDKTGTLTTNRMTVVESYICGHHYKSVPQFKDIPEPVGDLIVEDIAVNCSYSSYIEPVEENLGLPKQFGNKTECALLGFVLNLNKSYQNIRNMIPEETVTHVYTFNSFRKSMSTVIPKGKGGYRLYTKGASEEVLNKCAYIFGPNGKLEKLTTTIKQTIINKIIGPMAGHGLRTLTLAYRDFVTASAQSNDAHISSEPNWNDEEDIIKDLTALCIVGIEDPLRSEVKEAIKTCQRAGVTVCMVTGDNAATARSIAIACGILPPGDDFLVLEGKEFSSRIRDENGEVQQDLIDQIWPKLRVLARSSPKDKYDLVNGIKNSKLSEVREVVAVTGDGTNDGPALKKADVGFAMGIAGTEVAKEASDIILTDDNFNSIVKAIMWGRNVYDSISKFLQFQLTVTSVAIGVAFTGACTVQDSPITVAQMLWINLIMDALASLALATEKPTEELLLRKPYGRTAPLISKRMWKNVLGHGIYQLIVIFTILFYGDKIFSVKNGREEGNLPNEHFTILFNSFVMLTLFNEINSRKIHGERNVFKGIFDNYFFVSIWSMSFVIQILIVEFAGIILQTVNLSSKQWIACICIGLSSLIWGQILTSIPYPSEKGNESKA